MINLRSYLENGYNRNYIVVTIGIDGRLGYETFSTKEQAKKYNAMKLHLQGEVLTFRQAAKCYPDEFKF